MPPDSETGDPELAALRERYARNREYAKRGSYTTKLAPKEEKAFEGWLYKNAVPYDTHWPPDQSMQDYDMRGFWKAMQTGDPRAVEAKQAEAVGQGLHFPDAWKTPYHESFSAQSVYATPDAPQWYDVAGKPSADGPLLKDKAGAVLFDARGHR